jgi:hypothetical protein
MSDEVVPQETRDFISKQLLKVMNNSKAIASEHRDVASILFCSSVQNTDGKIELHVTVCGTTMQLLSICSTTIDIALRTCFAQEVLGKGPDDADVTDPRFIEFKNMFLLYLLTSGGQDATITKIMGYSGPESDSGESRN